MATGPLGVTWSLAVEEQFYLVWPLVVWFSNDAWLRKIAIGSDLYFSGVAFLSVTASSQYLFKHVLSFGRADGRRTSGACDPFG
jgi:peptidoglycan/LPS O-acetylase OafA/YrhL